MRRSQAVLLAALACVLAGPLGCSSSMEPQSGTEPRTKQDRERANDVPDGVTRGGGGGGGY